MRVLVNNEGKITDIFGSKKQNLEHVSAADPNWKKFSGRRKMIPNENFVTIDDLQKILFA